MRLPLIAAAALFTASVAARADVVYTYVGQPFTDAYGGYTTSESVTGTFDLASPLGPDLTDQLITPVSFSFSDGLQTLTQSNSNSALSAFLFWTDSSGNILQYVIGVIGYPDSNLISIDEGPYGVQGTVATYDGGFASSESLGTLTQVTSSVTPEPSSVALLATGLLGMAGILRRRIG